MNKIEQATAALKSDPSWSTSKLAEHLGIGERTVMRARSAISGHVPDNLPRDWAEDQDQQILKLRREQMSFRLIGIELDIGITSIRKRYRELKGGVEETGDKTDWAWKSGPLVQYVQVFGR